MKIYYLLDMLLLLNYSIWYNYNNYKSVQRLKLLET